MGVLLIAAGGAYFNFVYQPQAQSEAAAVKPPVAKKPQPVPAKPAATPASAVSAAPTQSVPVAVSPGVSVGQQPAVATTSTTAAPTQVTAATPEKPITAMQKDEPKKHMAETRPEQMDKPEQMDTPEKSQQVKAKLHDALPAPVEAESIAADEPAPQRGGITPKYNDMLTPVLRGDRDAVKQLLDLGWWVDKPGTGGITPLMAAVMNRDTQMVQLLLDHGAEPSVQALRLARKNKDTATAALLEQKGAR